jgi:serine/threonine protein kinase/Tol biopolymer transport system component
MTDARWQRAKQVFHEALEKSGPERAKFVAAASADDNELRAQVEGLLNAHSEAREFLSSPTGPAPSEALKAAAAVLAAGPPEAPGTRIGPYKLLQVIGEGGFGVVYMAEQEHPIRRRVALKVIKLGMDTKEVIARFEAERQALALMDHPNIARVLDAGATESGRPYFVMELVKGIPITEYCDANQLTARQRLELFADVCKAVHHAHEKGVIHRDIKPSNVMVTLHDGEPVPKVIDFGIAKAMNQPLTEKTLFTAFGEFIGTPWCMSPEQAAMGGLEIDRRCDVYALGVLLYELLTGTTPFEPEELRSRAFLEIMRIVREEDPPTPSARLNTLGKRLAEVANRRHAEPHALAKLVRGDLDWIVMKAMEKDRRRRYDSAADLADDLLRHFRHQPVNARRPGATYRLSKFARRRRGPLLAGAGIAVAVVGGGAIAKVGGVGSHAMPAFPVMKPHMTRIIGSDTLRIWTAALSPDGRWVAFSTAAGGETVGPLMVVSSEGGEPTRLTEGRASEATWFPDGSRIAYWTFEEGIATVPFDRQSGKASGPSQRVILGDEPASGFRLSPDGRWFAYRRWTGKGGMAIKVVPAGGGKPRTVIESEWRVWLMDWSADGRYLYYQAQMIDRPDARRTFRVIADGGQPEEVMQAPVGMSAPRVPYQIARVSDGPAEAFPLEIQKYGGSSVTRIALPQGARTEETGRTFGSDGRHLLTVVSASVSPVRFVSVAGGIPRQLGEARAGEWPLGWSADGNDVLFVTPIEGRQVIMRASLKGGAAREVGSMPDRGPPVRNEWAHPITFSADRRYLTYSRPTPGGMDRTLVVRPVAGGNERIVTRSLFDHSAIHLAGPGGTPNIAGEDFLYLEREADSVRLLATPPGGPSRRIRSFPVALGRVPKGVFGRRVAYTTTASFLSPTYSGKYGVSGRILVADSPNGTAKEVAALPEVLGFDDIVWSPDGRWIAASAYVGKSLDSYAIKVLVVGVAPNGDVVAPARLIDTPIIYSLWGLQWLPDGSAVTVTGQSPPDGRYDVWLVPVNRAGSPVALTSGERDPLAFNVLSPDGRFVVYRTWKDRGTSLWLADLGDALERSKLK